MKVNVLLFLVSLFLSSSLLSATVKPVFTAVESRENTNLHKAMELLDTSLEAYFPDNSSFMLRYYNPFLVNQKKEKASVWMYTSTLEALNAVLAQLQKTPDWNVPNTYYNKCYTKYLNRLQNLYENLKYYRGSFELVSYTQDRKWTVYAVDAVNEANQANVTGILNVYDDQMWLINELIHSYHITNNKQYLLEAEYLADYVLDGWDLTLDEFGEEQGGIPWGPGYVTKHACSNGPMISPLVALHKIHNDNSELITKYQIDKTDRVTRLSTKVPKGEYYLDFAKKIYDWQQRKLLNNKGVYSDMLGGCNPDCEVRYELINNTKYRKHTSLLEATGRAYSYNSGSMLSAAADLYEVTRDEKYLKDLRNLADASFRYFSKPNLDVKGLHTFDSDGFNNWFNTVLLKGYVTSGKFYNKADNYAQAFENNITYSFNNYLKQGMLPTNLLKGWNTDQKDNDIEGMFMFSYVVQYALLNN